MPERFEKAEKTLKLGIFVSVRTQQRKGNKMILLNC